MFVQVIKGWDEGVMQMSLGQRANLKISSDFGYGENGAGDKIPPNSDLAFDVELLAINGKGIATKAELLEYKKTLMKWMNGKLKEYDSDKDSTELQTSHCPDSGSDCLGEEGEARQEAQEP